jgi:hypothetical protein
MFRKGKALGELGFFEKAEKVLEELKTKNPSGVYNPSIHITSFSDYAPIIYRCRWDHCRAVTTPSYRSSS